MPPCHVSNCSYATCNSHTHTTHQGAISTLSGLFLSGNNPYSNEGGVLTMGDPSNNYMKWLRVRCFDNIGSWTDIFVEAQILPAAGAAVMEEARRKSLRTFFQQDIFYSINFTILREKIAGVCSVN